MLPATISPKAPLIDAACSGLARLKKSGLGDEDGLRAVHLFS
jgi:hypothetical protein